MLITRNWEAGELQGVLSKRDSLEERKPLHSTNQFQKPHLPQSPLQAMLFLSTTDPEGPPKAHYGECRCLSAPSSPISGMSRRRGRAEDSCSLPAQCQGPIWSSIRKGLSSPPHPTPLPLSYSL